MENAVVVYMLTRRFASREHATQAPISSRRLKLMAQGGMQ